ncbi:hypothetical protein B0A58_04460 [Flavobacterium branchiophilum NBRC 15030 = ATCC 35035]|uniref:Putative secreted protein (Por secretion system target) n=1 Tax=Flavobacterium branchiophilum TaxID=55197 RepID=A0A543G510_9FLAO|nr:T9SS type A sorting domain-containing protein [Flavobacterium branchiophilum]OXA78368.1 hypothetical protein B0A58_04460 [Flavobacterium branchiophilum NBRC 15030 = ATCC 35035]TQM41159.1 putative secreted protein (Por secretion system target) [Flavobacterium branchiophilum]GEM56254.1 T9SS C-terminal target domain-containing protein [Flavobacterium branchiophilum NBRC 15030 = ATCC 35035]
MKKIYALALILFASLSFGQTLLYESFDYSAPGNIGGNTTTTSDAVGANNWLTHSNTSGNSGTIDLASGSLSYTGLMAPVGNKVTIVGNNTTVPRDVNRAFTTTTTATTIYYSLLLKVVDNTQLAASDAYFFGIGGAAGTSVTPLGARLGIKSSNSGANFRLSIQNNSGGTPTFTENATDLTFGTTYLVVVKFDKGVTPNAASLWVNPTGLGGTEPTANATNNSGNASLSTFASVYIRNASGTPKAELDEIRVGETWAAVTAVPLAIDQNNIVGLDIFSKNGVLTVTTPTLSEKEVAIYDLLGKQVKNTTTQNNTVNVADLTSGIYIVKVSENGQSATRKLLLN